MKVFFDIVTNHTADVIDYEEALGPPIDGFRIDTVKHVDDAFWRRFARELLAFAHSVGRRRLFMFGEVFDTTRPFTSHFTTHDRLQAVLGFPFQKAAQDFAADGRPTHRLRDFFVDDDWYADANSNVYEIPLKDDTKPVFFIVHRPGGDVVPDTREPGGDCSFVPLEHPEIWLRQGSDGLLQPAAAGMSRTAREAAASPRRAAAADRRTAPAAAARP
jgi:hypothetical protein